MAVEFNSTTMKKLVESDKYLNFVYNDFMKQVNDEERVLRILFNSNVLEDSVITDRYVQLNK
ncbi:hypothetical protein DES38_1263 [Streptohalobacillus salinus]|uniref:Uncharacterized protein n=1 Tax=Streptohalobacillus salinus TaxID=621096 RepID=A0A2V3VVN6_9BACI|nr:hypothetical protein [Streptohalobacillus salinus]PXW86017.1 hypothetical protein DES38_1263 [Streptohalobacillus salinus]